MMIERNKSDVTGIAPYPNLMFYDTVTDTTLRSGSPDSGDAGRRQILFGGEYGNVLTGGDKYDEIYGDDGDDTLGGGGGNDYIEGGAGDDKLDGGTGSDWLRGGSGRDTYSFGAAFGNDTIVDSDGVGKIEIAGSVITDGKGVGKRNQWVAQLASGEYVGMAVYDASSSVTGKRMIMTKGLDSSNAVTIDNFDLAKALSSEGYLGIKLESQSKVALKIGPGKNVYNEPGFVESSLAAQLATISEGGAATFTMSLSAAAGAHETVTLSLSGVSGKLMVMVDGALVAAEGAVIALSEGQTEVVFALVQRGDFEGDVPGTLKASHNGPGGVASTNTIALSLKDTGKSTFTIIGDQHAPAGKTSADLYNWSAVTFLADGTLVGGVAEANFSDVLMGGGVKNKIFGLGGNDLIDGGEGDDMIDGGDGDDMIAGSQGNDHILGGKGNDYISSASPSNGQRRLSPDQMWTPPAGKTAIAAGAAWGVYDSGKGSNIWDGVDSSYYADNDFVDGGEGDDRIIGSHGDDQLLGGAGSDVLWGLSGNDDIEGGGDDDHLFGDGYHADPQLLIYQAPEHHGADFLDGGAGNDRLVGQGSSDVLYGGIGNDVLFGDTGGGPTSDPDYIPFQYQGNDYLDGEEGDDWLYGEGKDDTLYGGAGKDTLWGDMSASTLSPGDDALYWGRDVLDGGAGDDILVGGGKDDQLYGGTGNDKLWGDENIKSFNQEFSGNDFLDGGDGDDQLVGGGGGDRLLGGAGNDRLIGDDDEFVPAAFQGDDYLDGGAGDDMLAAGLGNDTLFGGAGNDTLNGGGGADYMVGGAGNDIYVIDSDGDIIVEEGRQKAGAGTGARGATLPAPGDARADEPGTNDVEASISYTLGAHLDAIRLTGINAIDATGNSASNGLFGNGAANVLTGAAGDDYLVGGGGNDVYVFDRGDGKDTIENTDVLSDSADPARAPAVDILRFGANVSERDIVAYRDGDILSLRISGSSEQVNILDYFAANKVDGTVTSDRKLDRIEFANGVVWNPAKIDAILLRQANNQAPVAGPGVPFLSARAGDPFSYTLAAANLTDPDADDKLHYSIQLEGGLPAPAWVKFDAATRTVSGVPDDASVGKLVLIVVAMDNYGAGAGIGIAMNIGAANRKPVLNAVPVDAKASRGTPLTYNVPANVFTDPDGDALTYKVTLEKGGSLPSWLSFNPKTGVLSGTPSTLEHLVLAITATDVHGLSAQTLMKLDVDNRAPTFGAWTQVPGGAANDVWQFTVPQGSFTDSDRGDTLSYAATSPDGSALPAWLTFDAATRTFSGRPPAVGKYDVLVKASDINGASVSAVLPITIDPNQVYSGTDAADVKEGGWGHDSLKGLGGNDTLLGSFGNDRLDGGAGNDLLKGGGGADTYVFGKGYGNDTIDNQDLPLQAGIDTIEFLPGVAVGDVKPTRADNDLILSLPASGDSLRVLNYFKADELALSQVEFIKFADGTSWTLAQILPFLLVGSAGNDKLYGSDTNDMLDGGAGNDRLDAGAGNDTLAGGTGSDDLIGGTGADTYRFNKGDGKDTISDVSPVVTVPDVDRLEFGAGLMPADVEAVRDGATLRLNFGNSGDAVTIWSYFSTRTDLNLAVEQIAFADGTLWTTPMVLQQVLKGTDLDDKLEGTAGNDVISGRKGQDSLLGLQGNDTLSGGAGNDTLDGGVGDDVLDGGAGRDRMVGGAGNDIFKFGHGDGPDVIVTGDTAPGKIDTIRFADDVLASDVLVERWKDRLVLIISSSGDTLFVEDYFREVNGVRTGKIEQVQFADGSSWNTAAVDQMAVPHSNTQPYIRQTGGDFYGNVNSTFNTVMPLDWHLEVDVGDALSYSIEALPGYPAVPAWLHFDPLTMKMWGTPGANDQGVSSVYFYATDLYGAKAGISINIHVGAVSVAPTVASPVADQLTSQGTSIRFSLGDVFADADQGDVVAYSATLSTGAVLPTWLTFDPVAREFSGMSAAAGTLSVKVTGTDLGGKSASDVFDIVVAPDSIITGTAGNDTLKGGAGNDIVRGLGGNDELESGLGRDTLEGGAGDDTYLINHDDDTVVENVNEGIDTVRTALPKYTLPANVDNLVFNGEVAGILTGNNLNNQLSAGAGAQTIDGGAGADTMAGGAGDDRYVVDSVLDNIVELPDGGNDTITSSLSLTLPVNVEALELTGTENIDATGNAANNKIRGNAGNNRLDGAGGRDDFYGGDGDDTYVVDSIDDWISDDSGNDTVETSISSPNLLSGSVENLTLTGAALSRFGNALNNIIKGNALNNTLNGLEGNDQLFGAGGDDTLSGGAGNDVYVVERGDGKDVILNDDVASAVDTLRFGKDIAEGDIWVQRSGENLLLLLRGTTDQVTFSKYFAADVTKDGAIVNNKIERVEFAGGVVWDQAKIQSLVDISSANKVPVRGPVSVAPFKAEVGKPLSFALAANTLVDPDPLDTFVYSASLANDVPLPAWLKFDVASRTFSGTPTVADVGSVPVKLWGTDNRGGRGYIDLPLVVSPANRTPVLAAALADQSNALGTAFSYVVPAGAFTDPDAGTVLSYSATMADGTALPAWLSFNATTRAFGGTPPAAGTFSVKVSARDSGNLSASDVFDLVVSVKNLTLTGTAGADQLNGGAGNDILNGLDGNDKLNGGGGNDTMDGGLGTDTMTGGAGDDVYVFDLAADVAVEAANEGNDTVKSSVSTVLGNNIEALTLTGTAPLNATGNALNNVLTGNSGDNTLDGGSGADILNGGSGNDLYIVDNVGDIVNEGNYVGVDTVQTGLNYDLGPYLDNLTLTGSLAVDGKGNAGNNVIKGNANNNVLDGGSGADALSGGAGNDTYIVDNASDTVVELANEGIDTVKSGVSSTLSANIEALFLTGVNGISGTGNALNNLLVGNGANNVLNGDAGDDLLQGGAGLDTLTDTLGNNLLDGGAGNDTLTAGVGREMLIGGAGNDVILTGDGADIIAFNRGDGQDVVNASTGKDNTVSLGKGVLYADLLFKKTANDLVLVTGAAEQITFKDWYAAPANRSVANLQVVIEGGSDYDAASASKLNNKKVEQFNFDGLAGAFDAARTANPALTSWALSSSLLSFYLSGSDTAALGGDLAYQYARTGNLSSMSMLPAGALLSSPAFGVTAQPLQAGSALRDLSPQLV
ncbi:putative Ig domain-containing protein [Massilia antarctica]|uniref:Ig domain-containing protein n=1 Tax=Massilia antarctica TaxID=2765360 RepID=A0AA49A877_9BURK|nr:putative Ig domain-containing protein [Massilia antarctica]QPI50044.1 putative Ig domain-containing protein [Massilia antarctica]QPI50074.1 putative Ig domain-containing protein [Massilia antarctica]